MKWIYNTKDLMTFIDDDTQTKIMFNCLMIKKRKRCISVFNTDGYRIISIRYMSSYKMCLLIERAYLLMMN